MSVLWIQPTGVDEDAYWRSVDENELAVVAVDAPSFDEEWHTVVFSTRANAEAWIEAEGHEHAVVSVRIIDDPTYGQETDG